MRRFAAVLLPFILLSACRQSDPEPGTDVEVMKDGAIVDVQSRRSDVYVGEEGILIDTPRSRVEIGEGGIQIFD